MRTPALIIIILSLLIGCKPEKVEEIYEYQYAHEAYTGSLKQAGLDNTALGRDWISLSLHSLKNPVNIELPYLEEFFLDPAQPGSIGYRFVAKRGHRVEIDIDFEETDTTLIFIDLFRELSKETTKWLPTASADSSNYLLHFEPRKDNFYVLRIQPELLRGGKFSVKIIEKQVLKFPVQGGNKRDIGSLFNDPRDGGRRRHHGIDIFARRYTPVIAPANTRVRRTGESQIGGNHVWLYDSLRNANYYFAHLQKISATEDSWVNVGDTIGQVGNTGNARTTPPHLHFGIYLAGEGPINPMSYVLKTDTIPDPIDPAILAYSWTNIPSATDMVYHITNNGRHDSTLAANTPVRILGKNGKHLRIQLENNVIGSINIGEFRN